MENGAALPVVADMVLTPTVHLNIQTTTWFATLANAWQSVAAVPDSRKYNGYGAIDDLVATQGLIRQDLDGLQLLTSQGWSPNTGTITMTLPAPTRPTASPGLSWPSYANLTSLAHECAHSALDGRHTFYASSTSWLDWREESLADQIRGWTDPGAFYTPPWSWGDEVVAERLEAISDVEVASRHVLYPAYVFYTLSELDVELRIKTLKLLLNHFCYVTSVITTILTYVRNLPGALSSVMTIIRTFMAHRHSRESADGLLVISTSTVCPRR